MLSSSPLRVLPVMLIMLSRTLAFAPLTRRRCGRAMELSAVGKAQNKQAELARKMELAKKQQRDPSLLDDPIEQADDEGKQLEEEHSEFAQLLLKNKPPVQSERAFTRSESITAPPSDQPKVTAKTLKRRKKASSAEEKANKKSKYVQFRKQEESARSAIELMQPCVTQTSWNPRISR
jgi:hypothetical protein